MQKDYKVCLLLKEIKRKQTVHISKIYFTIISRKCKLMIQRKTPTNKVDAVYLISSD